MKEIWPRKRKGNCCILSDITFQTVEYVMRLSSNTLQICKFINLNTHPVHTSHTSRWTTEIVIFHYFVWYTFAHMVGIGTPTYISSAFLAFSWCIFWPKTYPHLTGVTWNSLLNFPNNVQVYDKENNLPLDSSIATLPPIHLGTDVETPPLETLTETFSTTQTLLKTHILPVIRGGTDTTSYTLVQTYHIARLVTATKTLPPMEVYQFVPSKTLKEFNSRLEEAGSELHLELEFGDDGNQEDDEDSPQGKYLYPNCWFVGEIKHGNR